jgi:hypothetical protein
VVFLERFGSRVVLIENYLSLEALQFPKRACYCNCGYLDNWAPQLQAGRLKVEKKLAVRLFPA